MADENVIDTLRLDSLLGNRLGSRSSDARNNVCVKKIDAVIYLRMIKKIYGCDSQAVDTGIEVLRLTGVLAVLGEASPEMQISVRTASDSELRGKL